MYYFSTPQPNMRIELWPCKMTFMFVSSHLLAFAGVAGGIQSSAALSCKREIYSVLPVLLKWDSISSCGDQRDTNMLIVWIESSLSLGWLGWGMVCWGRLQAGADFLPVFPFWSCHGVQSLASLQWSCILVLLLSIHHGIQRLGGSFTSVSLLFSLCKVRSGEPTLQAIAESKRMDFS